MYSLVLKNAKIIDGTGKPAYTADIGIAGDKIAAIGSIQQEENCVDVSGKLVTPGFIDPHSHADCSLFLYPGCQSYVRQGITTFVGGQCGDSNAPIRRYWMRKYWEYDMWDEIDPFIYDQTTIQPVERVIEGLYRKAGIVIDWRTFPEYINSLPPLPPCRSRPTKALRRPCPYPRRSTWRDRPYRALPRRRARRSAPGRCRAPRSG